MTTFPDSEKRQSFRIPVTGERQTGELRFGDKRFPIQLLNESAGGFCALIDQPAGLVVGAEGLLCITNDWFEVRVANLEAVRSAPRVEEDDGKPLPAEFFRRSEENKPEVRVETSTEPTPVSYRIGLVRLADAFDPDFKGSFYSWAGLTCQLKHMGPGTAGVILAGIFLSAVVAFVPFTSLKVMNSDITDKKLEGGMRWIEKQSKGGRQTDADEGTSLLDYFAGGSSNGNSSKLSKTTLQIGGQIEELQKSIRRLPGAMPFTLPDVAKYLQLTDSQQRQIRELIDAATRMIKNLSSSGWIDANGKKTSEKEILDSTRKKVFDLLDDRQKTKWNELNGEAKKR
jgi:hypothetical protein